MARAGVWWRGDLAAAVTPYRYAEELSVADVLRGSRDHIGDRKPTCGE